MRMLGDSLQVNFEDKKALSIILPCVNFADSMTVISWLQARRLVLDTGRRFTRRIHFYLAYLFVVCSAVLVYCLGSLSGSMRAGLLTPVQWIYMLALFAAI